MPVHTDDDVLERPASAARSKRERPRRHVVLIHNDDFTPAGFVVAALVEVFRMDMQAAMATMLECHRRGVGACGTFPRDVAETKAAQVVDLARAAGHPLLCTAEPAPNA